MKNLGFLLVLLVAFPIVLHFTIQSYRDFRHPPEDVEEKANKYDCVRGFIFAGLYLAAWTIYIIDLLK